MLLRPDRPEIFFQHLSHGCEARGQVFNLISGLIVRR